MEIKIKLRKKIHRQTIIIITTITGPRRLHTIADNEIYTTHTHTHTRIHIYYYYYYYSRFYD